MCSSTVKQAKQLQGKLAALHCVYVLHCTPRTVALLDVYHGGGMRSKATAVLSTSVNFMQRGVKLDWRNIWATPEFELTFLAAGGGRS